MPERTVNPIPRVRPGRIGIVAAMAIAGLLAASAARWRAWSEPPTVGETTVASIDDDDPRRRVAAIRRGPETPLVDLLVRASDRDWRVRTAAFTELARRDPGAPPVPRRDMLMSEREASLYAWLESPGSPLEISGRRAGGPAAIRICDLYAGRPHTEFAASLTARCTPCHAPEIPATLTGALPGARSTHHLALTDPATGCTPCHADIAADHAGSAHANSTSHLQLVTVDPISRAVQYWDFGEPAGLTCLACHAPESPTAATFDPSAGGCVADFIATDCRQCHAQATADWERWRTGPRPQRAVWPPGTVLADGAPADDCTTCHAVDDDHRFAARRDRGLLRSAIDVRLRRFPGGETSVVVANLSGHALPPEGVRRAIEVKLVSGDGVRTRILQFARPRPAREEPDLDAPLAPGEIRIVPIAEFGGASPVRVEAIFVRDRFNPDRLRTRMHGSRAPFAIALPADPDAPAASGNR